ncbi:MAG: hypothetical protein ABGZ17_02755 [Planctomycetaceae bacterium]
MLGAHRDRQTQLSKPTVTSSTPNEDIDQGFLEFSETGPVFGVPIAQNTVMCQGGPSAGTVPSAGNRINSNSTLEKQMGASMKSPTTRRWITGAAWLLCGALLVCQAEQDVQAQVAQSGQPQAGRQAVKIAWHGTWKGGLAEAARTGKPILLVSAAPQCHSVPGVW